MGIFAASASFRNPTPSVFVQVLSTQKMEKPLQIMGMLKELPVAWERCIEDTFYQDLDIS